MRVALLLSLLTIALLITLASACRGGSNEPRTLVDGTPTAAPRLTLEVSIPQVWTRVSVVAARRGQSRGPAAECLTEARDQLPIGPAVIRVGVIGASVTLRTSASRGVFACDGAARRARDAQWCGRAYGRLVGGKLEDPRLDLAGCVTPGDEPIAFAWFEPGRGTAHVAVRQNGYVEVYPAAAGLPVRIATTSGIDLDTASATLHLSEFDGRGALIRSSTLDARVAG